MLLKLSRPIIAVILVLLIGEAMTRLLLQSPSPQVFDSQLGFTYRPYSEVFWGYEGFARNRFNSLGLNSPEIGQRIRPWRVLIIGDSYSEGRHVALNEHFISVAMNREPRLEVINAGREGLNVANFLVMQKRIADITHPDLTVVVLSAGRLADLDDGKVVTRRSPTGQIESIKYKIEEQDQIKQILAPILERSALAAALTYRFKEPAKKMLRDLIDTPARLVRDSKAGTPAPQPGQPLAPSRQSIDAASEKLEFVLRQMKEQGPTAVLYMPHLKYEARQQASVSANSSQREQIMRQVADSQNIPFISAVPEFLAEQQRTGQPLHGFSNASILEGHLNERGHSALGEALARLSSSTLLNK